MQILGGRPSTPMTTLAAILSPLTIASSSGTLRGSIPGAGPASAAALQSYLHPLTSPLAASSSAALPLFTAPSPAEYFTPLPSWSPAGPPQSGSTNDRRIGRASMAHRVAGSPFGSTPVVRRQQPASGRRVALRSGGLSCASGAKVRKYILIIHPEPVCYSHLRVLAVGHC